MHDQYPNPSNDRLQQLIIEHDGDRAAASQQLIAETAASLLAPLYAQLAELEHQPDRDHHPDTEV